MKTPSINLKININIGSAITILLVLLFLAELYFIYFQLYKKLNAQPTEVFLNRIVKVDLQAYQETSDLITGLRNYAPEPPLLENPNPFQYKQ